MELPLGKSQVMSTWALREGEILAKIRRRANILMWAGYLVYGGGSAALFLAFGDRPLTGLLIMMLFQFMVIWMGTQAMYQNMASVTRLSIEANRSMMPAFEKAARFAEQVEDGSHPAIARAEEKLAEGVAALKAIQEAIERSTKPMPVVRRGEKAAI